MFQKPRVSIILGIPFIKIQINHLLLLINQASSIAESPRFLTSPECHPPLKTRWNSRSFSTSENYWPEEKKRRTAAVSHYVFVRSLASILRKTDNWDSALPQLCAASSSEITPSTAAQVIHRIKNPDLAFRFFKWLDNLHWFDVDDTLYSAVIYALTRDSNPSHASIADSLLREKISLGFDATPADFDYLLHQWARVGRWDTGLGLLDQMKGRGFVPGIESCNALLQLLFNSKCWDLARGLFYQMLDWGSSVLHARTFNIAMKVLCKKGSLDKAFELFGMMVQKDCMPDLDSFNIMIRGCSEKGDVKLLCEIFAQMLDMKVKPDSFTVSLLIKELCKQGRPECGNFLFNHMRRVGWIDKKFVYSQLVDSLCNYGWWLKALKIFNKMVRRGHHPSITMYNNLMRRLCLGGRINQAFWLKELVSKKGFLSDLDNYNVLLDGLSLAGRMDMVGKILAELHHKELAPNSRTQNIVLRGYCMAGNVAEALDWVEKIKGNGWTPDQASCNSLITGLAKEGKSYEALQMKSCIQKECEINHSTYTVLIDELAKLGDMNRVTELFNEMKATIFELKKPIYDVVISGYCSLNNIEEARNVFCEMISRGCKPDCQTYGSIVASLSAGGRISDILQLWEGMVRCGYQHDVSSLIVCKLCENGYFDAADKIIYRIFDCKLLPDKEIFSVYLCNRLRPEKLLADDHFLQLLREY